MTFYFHTVFLVQIANSLLVLLNAIYLEFQGCVLTSCKKHVAMLHDTATGARIDDIKYENYPTVDLY